MDALLQINRHFGITVICNLHSLDLARSYCDRLVGLAAGRVVFDGAPAALTRARRARSLRPGSGRRRWAHRGPSRLRRRQPCRGLALGRVLIVIAPRNKEISRCSPVDSSSVGAARRRARPCRTRRTRRDWKAKYPELVMAIVPAENASGVTERYAPFVEYLSKELGTKVTLRVANDYAAVIEGQRNGNIHIAGYGPASYARAVVTGVKVEPFAIDVNNDGTIGYYSVFYVQGRQPLQDDRGSQGQESRPGRSQLDLGQQRAALRPEQA